MNWRKNIKEYFTFTRGNRIAILIILAFVVGIFFLPELISESTSSKQTSSDTSWIGTLKRIEQKEIDNAPSYTKYNSDNSTNYQYDRNAKNYYPNSKEELFYFDPNTISAEGWKRLGLRDKTIVTIQNYLNKGGKFRKAEDVSKIYGLFPNEYERIAPFIKIAISSNAKSYNENIDDDRQTDNTVKDYSKKYLILDINTANVDDLISLPGIGPSFSNRIIKFRDKLGGFYSVNQVGETFGLPDSTFQKIKKFLTLENVVIKKININSATVEELKTHPYISWNIANTIVAYRNQHGNYLKLDDLKKIMTITEELFDKISPYLIL